MTSTFSNMKKLPSTVMIWVDEIGSPYEPWNKPEGAKPVLIKAGETGYYPLKPSTLVNPDHYNLTAGDQGQPATKQQIAAMLNGSMFGFHCPAADVDSYDENGEFLVAPKQKVTVMEAAKDLVAFLGGDPKFVPGNDA